MKVLIIGGSGFIGKAIVNRLRHDEPEWDLTVVDDLSYGKETYNLDEKIEFKKIGIERICDAHFLDEFGIVINLACVHLLDSGTVPIRDFMVNTQSVLKLLISLNYCQGIKYIHFSSGSVYQIPLGYGATTHYVISKYTAELYTKLYTEFHGLKATIIRPFAVYGPGGINVVNKFLNQAIKGEPYTIHNPGTQEIRPTYVDDVASIVKLIIDKNIWQTNLNAVGYKNFSINNIADHVDIVLERKNERVFCPPPVKYGIVHLPSIWLEDPLKEKLGWEQPYTFDERLKQMVEML